MSRRTPANGAARADWMLDRLSRGGVRLTRQRAQVVRRIASQGGAFGPESLVDELRVFGVGRATVYRTLERMERMGMLARIHIGADQGYTVCDEGHHHHLVCGTCHSVVPVDATGVERAIQALAKALHCRIDVHMLEFAGECARCLGAGSNGVASATATRRPRAP